MLPAETPASSGPDAHSAWCSRTYPVSATSVALSAALSRPPVISRRRRAGECSGPRALRLAGAASRVSFLSAGRERRPIMTIAAPVRASSKPPAAAGATPAASALATTGPAR